MANSYVVSSLPEYVEQRREELIAKSVMGAKTLDFINLQTGVKGPTALNLIDFDIQLQDDACGWNEAGTSTLTQRIIDAKTGSITHRQQQITGQTVRMMKRQHSQQDTVGTAFLITAHDIVNQVAVR